MPRTRAILTDTWRSTTTPRLGRGSVEAASTLAEFIVLELIDTFDSKSTRRLPNWHSNTDP